MRIRYRWHGEIADAPAIGAYLRSPTRPRGAYLVHGMHNLGLRGGLGAPYFYMLAIDAERVPAIDADAGPTWPIVWDRRG